MLDATALGPDATSVYLYYDENDVLIYVGITSHGERRQKEHNKVQPWWPLVASQMVEHYPIRRQATDRESALIAKYCPPFNSQGNPKAIASRTAYFDSRSLLEELTPTQRLRQLQNQVPLQRSYQSDTVLVLMAATRHAPIFSEVDFAVSKPQVMGPQFECGRLVEVAKHGFSTMFALEVEDDAVIMSRPFATVVRRNRRFVCTQIRVAN